MLQDLKSYEFASSSSMVSFYGICLYQNMVFLHSDLTRGFLPSGIERWHQSSVFKIQMEDVEYKNWHWVMRGKSPVTSIDPQSVTLSKSLNLLCLSLWCSDMISMCTLSQGCCASYLMSACKMICRFEWQRLCNCTALLCCVIAEAAGSLWQATCCLPAE